MCVGVGGSVSLGWLGWGVGEQGGGGTKSAARGMSLSTTSLSKLAGSLAKTTTTNKVKKIISGEHGVLTVSRADKP